MQTDEIVTEHQEAIKEYATILKEDSLFEEYYENYLTILGYAYRLEHINDRLFYTFQEAVYSIDLAKQLKDYNGIELNSFVYILVINTFIEEYFGNLLDEQEKQKAINTYKIIEEKRAKEAQKYHIYQ